LAPSCPCTLQRGARALYDRYYWYCRRCTHKHTPTHHFPYFLAIYYINLCLWRRNCSRRQLRLLLLRLHHRMTFRKPEWPFLCGYARIICGACEPCNAAVDFVFERRTINTGDLNIHFFRCLHIILIPRSVFVYNIL